MNICQIVKIVNKGFKICKRLINAPKLKSMPNSARVLIHPVPGTACAVNASIITGSGVKYQLATLQKTKKEHITDQ